MRFVLPAIALLLPVIASAQTNRVPVQVPDTVILEANISYDKYADTVLDVMRPKAEAKGKRPGVIMIHGGGWIRSTKETMMNSRARIRGLQRGISPCAGGDRAGRGQ
jgi:acetyl esterase/lipase